MDDLRGLTFVITGKLSDGWLRKDATVFIESSGGRVARSITYSVDYLVVGDKPGKTKLRAARDRGVKVITEDEFYDLLEDEE